MKYGLFLLITLLSLTACAGQPTAGIEANSLFYVEESGHTVGGDFLRYFDTHGGKVRFGWPISEPFLLEGRLTQDFQSARFF